MYELISFKSEQIVTDVWHMNRRPPSAVSIIIEGDNHTNIFIVHIVVSMLLGGETWKKRKNERLGSRRQVLPMARPLPPQVLFEPTLRWRGFKFSVSVKNLI